MNYMFYKGFFSAQFMTPGPTPVAHSVSLGDETECPATARNTW